MPFHRDGVKYINEASFLLQELAIDMENAVRDDDVDLSSASAASASVSKGTKSKS